MNWIEFEQRCQKIAHNIRISNDNELFIKLRLTAEQRGGNADYEEVCSILDGLVYDFQEELKLIDKKDYYLDAVKTLERAGYEYKTLDGNHFDWYIDWSHPAAPKQFDKELLLRLIFIYGDWHCKVGNAAASNDFGQQYNFYKDSASDVIEDIQKLMEQIP